MPINDTATLQSARQVNVLHSLIIQAWRRLLGMCVVILGGWFKRCDLSLPLSFSELHLTKALSLHDGSKSNMVLARLVSQPLKHAM